ncbi:MAG: hypothetical protein ACYTGZ_08475 [Planctomycetota bacterium]|jgi:hypothetical protein
MRWTAIALVVAFFGAPAVGDDPAPAPAPAPDPTLDTLRADTSKGKALKAGISLAKNLYKAKAELTIGKKGASLSKVEKARTKWRDWLDGTKESLGINLYAHPRIVISIIDEARTPVLNSLVKLKKGALDWGAKDAPGYSRGQIEYTVFVPRSYTHKIQKPMPLVLTLHGRAINLRHPSLKKAPQQRSRIVVWNNWAGDGKTKKAYEAVVVAPNGRPEGYSFEKDPNFIRQTLFLGMDVGHTDYRTDPLATFLEVYGDAIQVGCEYCNLFAGIVWRDREDQNQPAVSDNESMLFDNLNGRPLYYVADKKKWAAIGEPTAKALKAAYERAGKPENLIIEQVDRDANGALKADPAKMAKFLTNRLPMPVRQFKWMFWHPNQVGPLPLYLSRANYAYDSTEEILKMPLRDRCGTIDFKVSVEMEKGKDGKETPYNLFDLQITEAEEASIFLYESMVDLDLPITVKVNGNVIIDKEKVRRNWTFFEQQCMPRNFFIFPLVGELKIKFPFKPRVDPKPEKKPEEGTEKPEETGKKEETGTGESKGAPAESK